MRFRSNATMLALVLSAMLPTNAQTKQQPPMPDRPGMDMHSTQMPMPKNTPGTSMNVNMDMSKPPTNLIEAELSHITSGTSVEPASTPVSMLMHNYRGWTLMLHGSAFIADIQQHAASNPSSPSPDTCRLFNLPCAPPVTRGGDKFFSTNWLMPMAMRKLGPGQLTLRAMFSLDPVMVSNNTNP